MTTNTKTAVSILGRVLYIFILVYGYIIAIQTLIAAIAASELGVTLFLIFIVITGAFVIKEQLQKVYTSVKTITTIKEEIEHE